MAPGWTRWLPCAVAHLRIVADPAGFPRSVWSELPEPMPWDNLAWCDPGAVDEWVAQARAGCSGETARLAEQHAREAYETGVTLRTARAGLFADMCRRQGLAVPHTVAELLLCLLGFGLFEAYPGTDGQEWLAPRLDRNPLDVLPLTEEEMVVEARAQHEDRIGLTGIALRKLAEDVPATGDRRSVTISLPELAAFADLPIGQVCEALRSLAAELDLRAEPDASSTAPITLELPWSAFEWQFRFDEPPAPEHAL
jgi:hypothetical protein